MQAGAKVTATGDSKAAIGEALKQALSGNRLQSISLHDERGDVLWLDEGALGPDEHNLAVDACAALTAGMDKSHVFQNIGDGRAAAFLPARSPTGELVGLAMIIADAKFLDTKGAAKFVTPATTTLMRRLAFLRKPPTPTAAPVPPSAAVPAAQVASPAAKPPMPAAPARAAAAPAPARPAMPAPKPAAPPVAARPAAPPKASPAPAPRAPAAPAAAAAKPAPQAEPAPAKSPAETDSIAFEITDIDPAVLLRPAARPAAAEPKRPDLRVVQSGRVPKLELSLEPDALPELIADDPPVPAAAGLRATPEPDVDPIALLEPMSATADDAPTAEVAELPKELAADATMSVAPEFVDEEPAATRAGDGQFEFYGQVYELHVQQLVKLRAGGGTKRFEVLVRDAHADNEFGVAPERVLHDVHDPSANSDLDRIVVEQLVTWMAAHRAVWESEPASFSVNVGMGTIADAKFCNYVAAVLRKHKVPAKAIGFEITEKSCVEQVRDVDLFVQACEKLGCHLVLDDYTLHHNSMRWLGSPALKFLKLDSRITTVAMKERVPQSLVVAITQASKVLGLSCVAKRVDTPAVRDWMAAVGIDYAQGFLLDQPRQLVGLTPENLK